MEVGVLNIPICFPLRKIRSPAEWDFSGKQLPDKKRYEWEKSRMDGRLTLLPPPAADKRQKYGINGM
jgi:hypothetical protein